MANTYTQIYIHIIFSVKGRESLIKKEYKKELQKYITGIVNNKNQKMIEINCMPDHIHILIGINPDISISSLVRDIKANSSRFINKMCWVKGKFQWQGGYGAFSYSRSQINSVIRYINNQEKHHKVKTFREEYIEFLEKFNIDYNKKYIFK
ncbi:IS200/IS605 family transposase [candidate division KSB1 bacterium]|nr:MAG: IS200/IS605 family transposase [candidate division KSB1 bacterium]